MEYSNLTTLTGKAVLITGGTTDIGRATAELLVKSGARVMIFGRYLPELDKALHQINAKFPNGKLYGMLADAVEDADFKNIFDEIDNILGPIDILVNNASVPFGIQEDYDDWQYVINTNLLAYMICAHEAAKRMSVKGNGHIVNVSSLSTDEKERENSVYIAIKSGVQGFSAALREEINAKGIKVTLIEPEPVVATTLQFRPTAEQQEKVDKREMLKAEDIAASIYYALMQPKSYDIVALQIRPHLQFCK